MKSTYGDEQQVSVPEGTAGQIAEDSEEYVVPGVPIVRNSSPRPQSLGLLASYGKQEDEHETMAVFPIKAPSAPPVPEAYEETTESAQMTPLPLPGQMAAGEASSEFLWLFEYGLEMDSAVLNSTERLNGLALPYGSAVLKGYALTFDALSSATSNAVATIVPERTQEAEVWGVLYRVPRRFVEGRDAQPAVLDMVHAAVPPHGLFERVEVVVHEVLRARDVACITYIASATARNIFHLLPRHKQSVDVSYAQGLLAIARQQQFPEDYLRTLMTLTTSTEGGAPDLSKQALEQHTEPLPVLPSVKRPAELIQEETKEPLQPRNSGLVIFALYLVLMLMTVFVLAILQGIGVGSHVLPTNFTVVEVPWWVSVYGLLGGCLSAMVALGRLRSTSLPNFVLITWFARPYVGIILAMLMYLLFHSGFVHAGGSGQEQQAMLSLLAVLAGFSERWIFYKRA